jgi:hypothetical protein
MYSKTLTFTTTQLNTHNVQSGTIAIYNSPSGIVGGSKPYYSFPRAMQFKNTTGATVKIGLIDSDQQMSEYQKSAANFSLVSVANNDIWYASNLFPLPKSKYMLVQCASGIVSADLNIDFMLFGALGAGA